MESNPRTNSNCNDEFRLESFTVLGFYEEALILLDPLVKTEQYGQVKYMQSIN